MNLLLEDGMPIHFLKTNPRGWLGASLPKFKTTLQEVMVQTPFTKEELKGMPWSQRHDYLNSYALKRQERKWEDEVGIKPEDSHFTLIVPIRNEEKSLPSFLRTLMFLDIPSSVNMKIIFILNACTDASNVFIDKFLSSLGIVDEETFKIEFEDRNLNKNYKITKQNGISFMCVDTPTPGKANALDIGNSIAHESGHTIAMSVDANNYLEPDAIRVMFAHARNSFHGKPKANDTVLLCCVLQAERKASLLKNFMNKANKMRQHLVEYDSGVVNGCFIAWNTEWMYSIGGPPKVALEDYAMGVLARVNNYKFEQVKGANIWVYDLNDFRGLLDTRARYVRGRLQLLDLVHYDPSIVRMIENEAYYMKNLVSRLKYLLYKCKKSPQNIPKYAITFLLWELALRKGKRDYKQNPTNYSWKKIDATY